jgi:hypothetical protein
MLINANANFTEKSIIIQDKIRNFWKEINEME